MHHVREWVDSEPFPFLAPRHPGLPEEPKEGFQLESDLSDLVALKYSEAREIGIGHMNHTEREENGRCCRHTGGPGQLKGNRVRNG